MEWNGSQFLSVAYRNSDVLENDNNWWVYVLIGWQGESEPVAASITDHFFNDADADSEPTLYGATRLDGVSNNQQISSGLAGAVMFKEVYRDKRPTKIERTFANLIAHEIGHQFGLGHGITENRNGPPNIPYIAVFPNGERFDMGLMGAGDDWLENQNAADLNFFIPRHQNFIRSRVSSPGKGL